MYRRVRFPFYDAFGRNLTVTRDGKIITPEGLPLADKGDIFDITGHKIQRPANLGRGARKKLEIQSYLPDGQAKIIGYVTIDQGYTTLYDVLSALKKNIAQNTSQSSSTSGGKIGHFIPFIDGSPIPDYERETRVASDFLPTLFINILTVQGKRTTFDGMPFRIEIDQQEIDDANALEKQAEFTKQIDALMKKKKTEA
eukprot:c21203_g2_i1.p1 GENE.c21203_g2_i1~~c21203_g2_i1.p1  ORF type:complete len:198 (+),score=74.13 c21203_g2_i1:235-828(+)